MHVACFLVWADGPFAICPSPATRKGVIYAREQQVLTCAMLIIVQAPLALLLHQAEAWIALPGWNLLHVSKPNPITSVSDSPEANTKVFLHLGCQSALLVPRLLLFLGAL